MKRMKPTATSFSRANAECQENIDETEKDLTEMFFRKRSGKIYDIIMMASRRLGLKIFEVLETSKIYGRGIYGRIIHAAAAYRTASV